MNLAIAFALIAAGAAINFAGFWLALAHGMLWYLLSFIPVVFIARYAARWIDP